MMMINSELMEEINNNQEEEYNFKKVMHQKEGCDFKRMLQ